MGTVKQVDLLAEKCPACGRRLVRGTAPGGAVLFGFENALFYLHVCKRCVRVQRVGTEVQRQVLDRRIKDFCAAQFAVVQRGAN